MSAKDPVIDPDDYMAEAVDIILMLLPEDFPAGRLILMVLDCMMDNWFGHELIHQSRLDALYEEFDAVISAMET
jgi:hypothetical protein